MDDLSSTIENNVDLLINRIEKLDSINENSEDLASTNRQFEKRSQKNKSIGFGNIYFFILYYINYCIIII